MRHSYEVVMSCSACVMRMKAGLVVVARGLKDLRECYPAGTVRPLRQQAPDPMGLVDAEESFIREASAAVRG